MWLTAIQVESYAGHKADETPRRFCRDGIWIEVREVLDRWHQGSGNVEWPEADYFKIAGDNSCNYLLKHDLESDLWFLAKEW